MVFTGLHLVVTGQALELWTRIWGLGFESSVIL